MLGPGLSLTAAVRARTLVATAAGACLADHETILLAYSSARGRVVLRDASRFTRGG
jgi:hypothetical protein